MEVRIVKTLCWSLIAFLVGCGSSGPGGGRSAVGPFPEAYRSGRRLLVAAEDYTTRTARLEVLPLAGGLSSHTAMSLPPNTVVRSPAIGELDFLLMRSANALRTLSKRDGSVRDEYRLGDRCSPQDVLPVSATEALVTCLDGRPLRKIDVRTGAVVVEIPVDTKYAIPGRSAGLSMMTPWRDGRVLVQNWRLADGVTPSEASYLLVVDPARGLVERDFRLAYTNPFPDFHVGPGGTVYVAAIGRMGKQHLLDGLIERLDGRLEGERSIVARETDLGGDILDFAILDDERGVALVTGDETRLVAFRLGRGPDGKATEVRTLHSTNAYEMSGLVVDRAAGEILVGQRNRQEPGVRVYSLDELKLKNVRRTSLPPASMALLR